MITNTKLDELKALCEAATSPQMERFCARHHGNS